MKAGIEVIVNSPSGDQLDVRVFRTPAQAQEFADAEYPASDRARLFAFDPEHCGVPVDLRVGGAWLGPERAMGEQRARGERARARILRRLGSQAA